MTLLDAARLLGNIPLENVEVALNFKINLPPGDDPLALEFTRNVRITKIRRQIRLIGNLTTEQRETLLQEAACCPISNTLSQSVKIEDIPLA
ncbi:MAG: OsmC family protein [Nitrospinota bacterium]